jgi:hypothetical protein
MAGHYKLTFVLRYESMLGTLQMMEEKYGGVEGYVKTYCKLTDEDIAIIRKNLVSEDEPTLA